MSSDDHAMPDGWMATGTPDRQTVTSDWLAIDPPSIDGVTIKEIRPVATSNGYLTEVFGMSGDLIHRLSARCFNARCIQAR